MFSFFLQVLAFYKCRMRWCSSSAFHLLRCVRLRLCSRRGQNRLPLWIREIWAYMRLLAKSLYFNSLTDSDVVFDSVFEPVFLTVDYVTRWFGLVSVLLNGYEKVVVVVFFVYFLETTAVMENKDINLLGIGQNIIFHTQVTVVVCGIITTKNDIFL